MHEPLMTRRASSNLARTKHQLRGFMMRRGRVHDATQIHRLSDARRGRRNRQRTSPEGSWFHDGGFMMAAKPPSSLARRR